MSSWVWQTPRTRNRVSQARLCTACYVSLMLRSLSCPALKRKLRPAGQLAGMPCQSLAHLAESTRNSDPSSDCHKRAGNAVYAGDGATRRLRGHWTRLVRDSTAVHFIVEWSVTMSLSTPSTSVPKGVAVAHDATSQAALAARRTAFRTLHERGCFVIPNPWMWAPRDTCSTWDSRPWPRPAPGFAFSQGLPDSTDDVVVSRDRSLAYTASITAAVDRPGDRGLHVRVWVGAGGRGRERRSLCRDGRSGPVDRGRHW